MKLPTNLPIAVGPVIIENGQVLLDKENKNGQITPWYFPGGGVEDFDIDLEATCRREVKEELGIDIEIIRPIKPLFSQTENGEAIILIHYLAKRIGEIKLGSDVVEYGWHDINNLPVNCAENVYKVIADFKNQPTANN